MKTLGKCYAVAREDGLAEYNKGVMLAVDTFKDAPPYMKRFSGYNPFYFNQGNHIPVPGQPDIIANSVESVWQGLKLLDGTTAFNMFKLPPWKRPPDHERTQGYEYHKSVFLYGNRVLSLLEARFLIYLPTYLYVLELNRDSSAMAEIIEALQNGRDVCFYDWDWNMDIKNISSSFSHSAILASFFNGNLQKDFLDELNEYVISYS